MSFKDVWGFDPEEMARCEFAEELETTQEEGSSNDSEHRTPRIPPQEEAQVYELRRLFRL